MNDRALVLSVEHSGTRFVKNHLLRGHPRSYQHLVPEYREYIEGLIAKYSIIFVPLRHPLEISRSWARKGMSLQLLPKRFEFLATLSVEPLWIPVDTPDRDDYIATARERTGLPLDPGDWPKVGHERANADYQMTDDELAAVVPVIRKHYEFFNRFYAEPLSTWRNHGSINGQRGAA